MEIAHACSRKGGSPGSYKAPGINMRWGRVGGAGSAAALRKGPRVGLRSLAAKLRRTRRRGLQERWGKEPGVEMGARPESAAENQDGFRGAGPVGGMERRARVEKCALPGTLWRLGVGGGARGRGALRRGGAGRDGKEVPEPGLSARLELTGAQASGAAGRRGGGDGWAGTWVGGILAGRRRTERGAGGEASESAEDCEETRGEEVEGGRALRGGPSGDMDEGSLTQTPVAFHELF